MMLGYIASPAELFLIYIPHQMWVVKCVELHIPPLAIWSKGRDGAVAFPGAIAFRFQISVSVCQRMAGHDALLQRLTRIVQRFHGGRIVDEQLPLLPIPAGFFIGHSHNRKNGSCLAENGVHLF